MLKVIDTFTVLTYKSENETIEELTERLTKEGIKWIINNKYIKADKYLKEPTITLMGGNKFKYRLLVFEKAS